MCFDPADRQRFQADIGRASDARQQADAALSARVPAIAQTLAEYAGDAIQAPQRAFEGSQRLSGTFPEGVTVYDDGRVVMPDGEPYDPAADIGALLDAGGIAALGNVPRAVSALRHGADPSVASAMGAGPRRAIDPDDIFPPMKKLDAPSQPPDGPPDVGKWTSEDVLALFSSTFGGDRTPGAGTVGAGVGARAGDPMDFRQITLDAMRREPQDGHYVLRHAQTSGERRTAQAAVQDAIRRIERGEPFPQFGSMDDLPRSPRRGSDVRDTVINGLPDAQAGARVADTARRVGLPASVGAAGAAGAAGGWTLMDKWLGGQPSGPDFDTAFAPQETGPGVEHLMDVLRQYAGRRSQPPI